MTIDNKELLLSNIQIIYLVDVWIQLIHSYFIKTVSMIWLENNKFNINKLINKNTYTAIRQ